MADTFTLNQGTLVAWSAQIKAQKGVMLEPQVRKSGDGFKVVHRMPLASLLHGLLWKISKGYRNNRIEERHAYLNVLEDQLRESYGVAKKYSDNGHRLAKPENAQGVDAQEAPGREEGAPHLPSKCYKLLDADQGPSPALFERIRGARENASVSRKAYMTSLHEVFLGIASKDQYEGTDDIGSFKQEWRKPEGDTNNTNLAEACRRETIAYETKREKAFGNAFVSETLNVLPPLEPATSGYVQTSNRNPDGIYEDPQELLESQPPSGNVETPVRVEPIYEDPETLLQGQPRRQAPPPPSGPTTSGYVETPDRVNKIYEDIDALQSAQPTRPAPPPPAGETAAPPPPPPFTGTKSQKKVKSRPTTPVVAPKIEFPPPPSLTESVEGLAGTKPPDSPDHAAGTSQSSGDESIKNPHQTSL